MYLEMVDISRIAFTVHTWLSVLLTGHVLTVRTAFLNVDFHVLLLT